jgi:hypothetical protein
VQMDNVIRSLAPSGAVIVWADAPRPGSGTGARGGSFANRFGVLNNLIAQADARWRQVVTLPVAEHVDAAGADVLRDGRPDGIHFTVEAASAMVDDWLVRDLLARQQQAVADAAPCRTTTGPSVTLVIDACRVTP